LTNEKQQRILKTIFYYTSFIGLGLASGVLGPSLLRLADNTTATIAQASSILLFHALGYMIGAVIGGRGYDRIAGHPIMSVGLIIIAASLAFTPVTHLLWVLGALMLVLGMSQGALDVGGNTLLVWVHGKNVGPFMNGLHLFFGIGAFMAPILVAQAMRIQDNLNWAYWGMALFMLIPAVGLAFIKSPPRKAESDEVGKSGGRSNILLLGMIIAFYLFYVGMEVGFTGWIFTYATTSNLLTEVSAAYATSLFWGTFTLGRLLSIPIAIKLRPRYVLTMDLVGCFACILILLLWPGSVTALWISIAGTGLFAASIFPTMITFAENRMHLTGKITSLFFVGASTGGMFFPWLIGQCYASVGPRMVPFTIISSTALLILLFGILVKKFPGKAIS
jgi:MFS transporter, FHS family, Na+ dependent glucose transporter 1